MTRGDGRGEAQLGARERRGLEADHSAARQVEGVTAGSEDKVRHYLESVVAQANAPADTEPPERDEDREPEPQGPDAEMTERFRSFAEPEPDGSESEQED